MKNQRRKFESLLWVEQRANLLRRFRRIRREMEQYQRDLDYWNDLQRSRGGPTIALPPDWAKRLAEVDQLLSLVKDLRE